MIEKILYDDDEDFKNGKVSLDVIFQILDLLFEITGHSLESYQSKNQSKNDVIIFSEYVKQKYNMGLFKTSKRTWFQKYILEK